jgi:hypothetical protein
VAATERERWRVGAWYEISFFDSWALCDLERLEARSSQAAIRVPLQLVRS